MEQRSPITAFLVALAAFIIVVAGMRTAESLLVPFLLSLFVAVICTPPLLWLKARGVPGWLAMLIVILNIVIGGTVVGIVVGSAIGDFRQDLPEYQLRLSEITAGLFQKLSTLGVSVDAELIRSSFNPGAALAVAGNTLAGLGNLMTNAFMILLTVVFILGEEVGFSEKLKSTSRNSEKTIEAINQFSAGVNRYMAIKALMSLLTGTIILVWLWILGVDYFVLWGMLAFLLNFVPTLGSIIAAIPAVLLAVVQLGVGDAVLVGVGFLAVNLGVGNILEPRVMGRGLDLSTLVVFLSLVFWGWVLGPVGMLLSIPLTITVKIALESVDETRWIGVLLSSGRGLVKTRISLDRLTSE
ncbi:AI-2E family transporter [Teredinibacter franksiae]|jgi:Predicted permease|uniref:AI-2E family transporter n=1 Tax=Teredinibacter franksiae TaxID=2761453 RepID=UPI00162501EC|nr:AI-2E family transporter [Teredinibacter franksiae]